MRSSISSRSRSEGSSAAASTSAADGACATAAGGALDGASSATATASSSAATSSGTRNKVRVEPSGLRARADRTSREALLRQLTLRV
jgi:hypothetical protein